MIIIVGIIIIINIVIVIVIIILTLHGLDGARLNRRGLFETCTPSRSTITRPWKLLLSLARSLSLSRSPNHAICMSAMHYGEMPLSTSL